MVLEAVGQRTDNRPKRLSVRQMMEPDADPGIEMFPDHAARAARVRGLMPGRILHLFHRRAGANS